MIRDEFDSLEIKDETERIRYEELVDIFVRARCSYSQLFLSSRFGLTDLYAEILPINPNPPLVVQLQFHSFQANLYTDSPDKDFLGHTNELIKIAHQIEEREYPDYLRAFALLRAAEFMRGASLIDAKQEMNTRDRGIELLIKAASLEQQHPSSKSMLLSVSESMVGKIRCCRAAKKLIHAKHSTRVRKPTRGSGSILPANSYSNMPWL